MAMEEKNKSEVARLRALIQAEQDAAYLGLHGLSAGSSKHETITAHMQRMGELHQELKAVDEDADTFLVETMGGNEELAQVIAEFKAVPSYFERLAREARRGKE